MARFLRLGPCWINLDLVTAITFVESHKKADQVVAARILYSNGKHDDFSDEGSIRRLREFLEAHEVK